MNRPKRTPAIQIFLRIIYVIALIYYLCNGNVFFDYVIIITGIGIFFSPITYFLIIGYAVFYDWCKH